MSTITASIRAALALTGSVLLILVSQSSSKASTLLSQVPPIYMPTEPGGKVCWQITQMTSSDQVLQSACSVPVNASGSTPLVPTPIPGPAPRPTPQPAPTPLPLETPIEIKIKKEELPTNKFQSQTNDQSSEQQANHSDTSNTRVIGELIIPALGVLKDMLD